MTDNVLTPSRDQDTLTAPIPETVDNPSASPSTQPATLPAPKPKPKGKVGKTKARPRRRVATSDNESDEDAATDGSLTDPSSGSEDDDEDEDEQEDDEKEEKKAVFPDTESTTPAVWADKGKSASKGPAEEMTFEESNRDGEAARGGTANASRGRGRGNGDSQRELTEEDKARIEDAKKRRREKQKAKRAELKEVKRKQREAQPQVQPQGGEAGGSKQVDGATQPETVKKGGKKGKNAEKPATSSKSPTSDPSSSLAASASALAIENPVPLPADGSPPSTPAIDSAPTAVSGRRGSRSQTQTQTQTQPQPQAQRVPLDPKVTPRVGGFWTHDQRLHEADSWRGRGGRGSRGFRGRGRGFGPGPAFDPYNHHVGGSGARELTADLVSNTDGEADGPVLAMDRLERELAAKEKVPASDPAPPREKEKKWGHEAFEAIQTQQAKRPVPPAFVPGPGHGNGLLRGGIRGRGRGRGGFIGRGGVFMPPFRPLNGPIPTFATGTEPPKPATATTDPAPTSATAPLASQPTLAPAPSAEQQSTVPDAESLLGDSGQAVTVRLPGSSQAVEVVVPAPSAVADSKQSTSTSTSDAVTATSNGQAVLYSSPVPPPAAAAASRPTVPVLGASLTNTVPVPSPLFAHTAPSPFPAGSENGSISSGGMGGFVPPQQGVSSHPSSSGYGAGGEFYPVNRALLNGQSTTFYPNSTQAPAQAHGVVPRSYPVQAAPQPRMYNHAQAFLPQQPAFLQEQFSGPQSHRGSFSGPPPFFPQPAYSDGGRGSPFNPSPNPYQNANANMGGYFSPARPSQKVSIRAPAAGAKTHTNASEPRTAQSGNGGNAPSYADVRGYEQPYAGAGQYYPQGYNPYTVNGTGNGTGTEQGYSEAEGYYPNGVQGQGQGYGWDQNGGYGYEGEYGY